MTAKRKHGKSVLLTFHRRAIETNEIAVEEQQSGETGADDNRQNEQRHRHHVAVCRTRNSHFLATKNPTC